MMLKAKKWTVFSSFLILTVYTNSGSILPAPQKVNLANPNGARSKSVQLAQNRQQLGVSVSEIARQVTVRILTNPGSGSGAIVGRQGSTYTVLTCDHVVANRSDNKYTVLTADGRVHTARWLRSIQFGNIDLAIVQFTSNEDYRVVELGDSENLSIGDRVYAAGFPNWHTINRDAIENTRDWGQRAYRLTAGEVGMIGRSLPRGYQLGYTNEIEQGMSGGPVLNRNGQLVAINGRLKYPLQGIDVYRYADGSLPSQTLFQQMEALSWAIPVSNFRQQLEEL